MYLNSENWTSVRKKFVIDDKEEDMDLKFLAIKEVA